MKIRICKVQCHVQSNRRRKNTTLSLTVPVQCLNGLRYGKKSRGFNLVLRILAGLERIILHPKKRETNIAAGIGPMLLLQIFQTSSPHFQIKLRNKTGIDPLLVSSAEMPCWQGPCLMWCAIAQISRITLFILHSPDITHIPGHQFGKQPCVQPCHHISAQLTSSLRCRT